MNREETIRMAREAGAERNPDFPDWSLDDDTLERFAALVRDDYSNKHAKLWLGRIDKAVKAERDKLAQWMIDRGYATGHGDTTEDLLQELDWQISENWTRGMVNGVEAERDACAKVADLVAREIDDTNGTATYIAAAIRARGQA